MGTLSLTISRGQGVADRSISTDTQTRGTVNSQMGGELELAAQAALDIDDEPLIRSRWTREAVVDDYEARLQNAKRGAFLVGGLLGFSRFLAICEFVWASAVLLGGFVATLTFDVFVRVSILTLLEQSRAHASAFLSKLLVRRGIIIYSQSPTQIRDHSADCQHRFSWFLRISSLVVQAFLLCPPFVLLYQSGFIRDLSRRSLILQNYNSTDISIKLFYFLVFINALVGVLSVICCIFVLLRLYVSDRVEQSIIRYYDYVLQRAQLVGEIPWADNFNFFEFAYGLMADDYARNVQPLAVLKYHKRLVEYLYAHRQGMDALLLSLESGNVYVQQAAASMVGFWVKRIDRAPVRLNGEVLEKLADKVRKTGQVGWAATNSLAAVAARDPQAVLAAHDSGGKRSVEQCLVDMVDPSSSRSLVFVRALIPLYDGSKTPVPDMTEPHRRALLQKLQSILGSSKVHRLRVLAGYILFKTGALDADRRRCEGNVVLEIQNIDPSRDNYFFESEKRMLEEMRQWAGVEASYDWRELGPNFVRAEAA